MPTRLATCACGQLTASCSGNPISVSLCHCLQCQRRTGSTYGIAAFFQRVNVTSAWPTFRASESGYSVTFTSTRLRGEAGIRRACGRFPGEQGPPPNSGWV
jgi:hypothetical protein